MSDIDGVTDRKCWSCGYEWQETGIHERHEPGCPNCGAAV